MSAWYSAAAVLAAGLLIYLVAVLLRPEDFS
jgi:K+-transporting ATPase KdpF subunit